MTESECRKDISHLTRKSTHLGKNERPLEKTFTGPKITGSDTNGVSSIIGRICLSICEQYVCYIMHANAQYASIMDRGKLFYGKTMMILEGWLF